MVTSAVSRFRAGADKTESRELRAHTERIKSAAWNKEGRKLASCSADKSVRIWSIDRSQSRDVLELRGHTRAVSCVAWDPEHSDKFASTSTDSTLRLWDVRSYRSETHVVQTKGENINMSWSSDGACIADDLISFIDPRGGTASDSTPTFTTHTIKIDVEANQFGWNFAGDLFFITTGTGRVKIFEYPSLKEVHTLFAHTSNAYCIDFEPSGRYFATGGADAIVALWDVETLTSVQTYTQLE
nr:THO complex subunit 3 [Polyrhizophydium stewartii]